MPEFSFEAVDASGARTRGTESAVNADALARTLEGRGLYLLDATEGAVERPSLFATRQRRDVLEFTRAMAALLPAGLPLARALDSATDLTSDTTRRSLAECRAAVIRGESLAEALAAFPTLFSPLYVGVVRAGERRGEVAVAFAQLAAQLERNEQLRGRLVSALLYPALLAVAGAFAIGVLLVVVLPQFTTLLADAGAALPRSTQLLVAVSALAVRGWPVLVTLGVGGVVTLLWLQRSEAGRGTLARSLLRLPAVGTLRRQVLAARFARLLSGLLGGGAPLYAALGDVIESLDDPVAREEAAAVRARIREGLSLRAALEAGSLFPPVLSQLVGVGEESSRLREFLLKAADLLDERAERAAQRTAALIEPAMIVLFGGVVALIAFSLLQAIYSINAGTFAR
ncbi:MAG: type II secretion system F family protein [Gemmatimonas sp.]|jgi:general secretion pathway protein F|uniref:type II secretion system F family protein n=2 Tax=Gemmatimonas sp. TaxID=1962908 RepID=UPI0022C0F069|nr:type II secretion system F family protein [Gemmatimonas sp.]MCA2995729.1 type II secretion system F family protein [Gemmatimonas sp.]MCE2953995.1 type II secretion system F family protein [Gemmatimonas sp.]MCZ8012479.1 type II secretion system F family protein [Gemmatimonas sp.]MCZ8268512.1 type II secretion system F family protein [Gemmatimonas sp.]